MAKHAALLKRLGKILKVDAVLVDGTQQDGEIIVTVYVEAEVSSLPWEH